ncbi:MAG TPA: zinc ribbon domain-containing protein [Vicinamibacterales bacterium]
MLLSLLAATVAVVMARPAAPENLVLLSLTIGAVGLSAVFLYQTIAPLVGPPAEEDREPLSSRLRGDLEREKALTLRSIKELEFDRAMGKLSEQDFEQMGTRLRARAMGIMKQLEAGSTLYRDQIEKELASRIGRAPDRSAKIGGQANAAADLKAQPRCACGTANDADARFCKSCGARLQGTAA